MPAADNTALDLVYQIIVDDDPSLEDSTFIGFSPDHATLIREINEDGESPKVTMGTNPVALEVTMVEVGVRGAPSDYSTPRKEAMRLRYLIARMGQDYTYDGLRMLWAEPVEGLRSLGRDNNRRQQFSILFRCTTEPSE